MLVAVGVGVSVAVAVAVGVRVAVLVAVEVGVRVAVAVAVAVGVGDANRLLIACENSQADNRNATNRKIMKLFKKRFFTSSSPYQ